MLARYGYVLAAVAAFVLFCGADDRRDLKMDQAVQGHWVTKSGRTHYYIGKGKLVMVDEGKPNNQTYEVLEINEKEDWIRIKIKTESGGGHEKTLRFASDKTGLLETISVKLTGFPEVFVSTLWHYVDDKTVPAGDGGGDPLKN